MKVANVFCISLFVLFVSYAQTTQMSLDNARLVPKLLNYQGYLTDTLGIPFNDSLDMTFKIFDAITSGNELWSEGQTNVPIETGVFSVLLGVNDPLPDSVFTEGTNRWLELTVETQALTPRTQITSVAYAYAVLYADTAKYAMGAPPELCYVEHDAVSSTSGTVWLDKAILNLNQPGDYLISATAEIGPSSGTVVGARLLFDGSEIGGPVIHEAGFYQTVSWVKKITVTTSSTVSIQYQRVFGSLEQNVYIKFARISARRLD